MRMPCVPLWETAALLHERAVAFHHAKRCGCPPPPLQLQDRGGPLALDTYMRLPTEQYNELDPSLILPLGKGAFLLKVPRVQVGRPGCLLCCLVACHLPLNLGPRPVWSAAQMPLK